MDGFIALKPGSDHDPTSEHNAVGESHYQGTFEDVIGEPFERGVYWDVVVRIGIVQVPEDPTAVGLMIGDRAAGFIARSEKDKFLEELAAIVPEGCKGVICKGRIVGGFCKGDEPAAYGLKLFLERPLAVKTR